MDVESSICLSDLVPALRWTRPQQIAEALGDPRLPVGWWSSMAFSRALGAAGLDWICERLARLAASRWDHMPLTDLLPALALQHAEPAPALPEGARTVIASLGGWQRLRRLTPGDLATPSAPPDVVLTAVFREVLVRLQGQNADAARPVQPATAPGRREASPLQSGSFPAVQPGGMQQPQPGQFPAYPAAAESPAPRTTGSFPAYPAAAESPAPRTTGSFPAVQPGTHRTGPFPAPADNESQRQTGPFPAQRSNPLQPNSLSTPAQGGGTSHTGTGAFPSVPPTGSLPGGPPRTNALSNGSPSNGAHAGNPLSNGALSNGALSNGAAPGSAPPGTRSPGSAASGAGPAPGSPPPSQTPPSSFGGTGSYQSGDYASSLTGSTGTASPGGTAVPSDTDHAMVRVVDNLFRTLDKLELAVAVHRLFAEDPVSLRTLAHKMLVDRTALSHSQRTAEERVLQWLRSSESAPVTGHMFRLTEWLGAAATQEQLIGADPAHPVIVPSLRTPLWRVLVTLMPDRRLQDGWLVVGDIQRLHARTRQLLASRPADTDVVELMAELGIRAHSAQAWLDALPAEASAHAPAASAASPAQPLPRRTPGANGHHHRGGQPIPPAEAGSIDPSAALATLSALSGGRSPMLAGTPSTPSPPLPSPSSDPRRWQRIEVTPEHLRGGPVPVPEGYAAQLGMRPGTLLSVTGPGDNAIVLVWQGHQPVFDSLRPVLMRLNARPGDQVYVTVDGYRLEAQLTG